jgi:CubicO group peptidase (beta-lactamase class C family)
MFAHLEPTMPGCAVGVYRAGELVFARGYGMANLEHGVRLTPETPIDVGAVTRQFTAFAVHLLAREGRLSLDDHVRTHLPELPDLGPVTLRHLLTHTSGMRDLFQLRLLAYPGWWTDHLSLSRAEAMDLLGRQRALNFAPGELFVTSNTDWMLLAMVVERASGRPFGEFLEQEIFTPLAMTSTYVLEDPLRPVPGRATPYALMASGAFRAVATWSVVHGLPGSSHLHSTVADLARWEGYLQDDPVAAGIVGSMYERSRLGSGDTIRYGHGVAIAEHRGQRIIHHGGQWDQSELVRFPERGLAVAVLCNNHDARFDRGALARAVAELYLDGLHDSPPATVPGTALERYAGSFVSADSRRPRVFLAHEGSLAEKDGEDLWPMAARGSGRFEDEDIRLDFTADGSEATLVLKYDGSRVRLTRMPEGWQPWTPTFAELARYAGAWHSDELGVDWRLSLEDGVLVVQRRGVAEGVPPPLGPNKFRMRDSGFTLEFRNPGEPGATMLLSMSRTRNLEFTPDIRH